MADLKYLYAVDKMYESNLDILKSIPKEFSLYRTEALIGSPQDAGTLLETCPNWVQQFYLDIQRIYYRKPKQNDTNEYSLFGLKWLYQGMKDIYNL